LHSSHGRRTVAAQSHGLNKTAFFSGLRLRLWSEGRSAGNSPSRHIISMRLGRDCPPLCGQGLHQAQDLFFISDRVGSECLNFSQGDSVFGPPVHEPTEEQFEVLRWLWW